MSIIQAYLYYYYYNYIYNYNYCQTTSTISMRKREREIHSLLATLLKLWHWKWQWLAGCPCPFYCYHYYYYYYYYYCCCCRCSSNGGYLTMQKYYDLLAVYRFVSRPLRGLTLQRHYSDLNVTRLWKLKNNRDGFQFPCMVASVLSQTNTQLYKYIQINIISWNIL